MRLLLVLVLVHGLAPGLAEVGESVVHYATTGHLAHTTADRGDLGDPAPEHGCGATQHQCTCCSAQLVAPSASAVVVSIELGDGRPVAPAEHRLARREAPRPFRPPIS